mgnify:FL=1
MQLRTMHNGTLHTNYISYAKRLSSKYILFRKYPLSIFNKLFTLCERIIYIGTEGFFTKLLKYT